MADPINSIEKEYLIVGEGASDAKFLEYLCDLHNLREFQIEDSGGSGHLATYLKGLKFRPGFERLKAILIVRDNDDSWEDSFGEVRKYLKKAGLPEPQQPQQVKRLDQMSDDLAVVVLMIPYTNASGPTKGSLDSLVLQAVEDTNTETKNCVNAFLTCVGRQRTKNQTDKFRLRCSVAALYPEDPNCSLQYVISPDKNIVPLTHPCFAEIAAFLRGFVALCAPVPRQRGAR